MSDCKVPCTATSTTIMKGASSTPTYDKRQVYFAIDNSIKIKTISMDTFDFMTSLNFLGSNLGLWPGMGLFQMLEGPILFIIGLKLTKKIGNVI